jgi:hypothetical protein
VDAAEGSSLDPPSLKTAPAIAAKVQRRLIDECNMIALTAINKMAASRDDEASRTLISGDANLIPVMGTARARTYPDPGYEGAN